MINGKMKVTKEKSEFPNRFWLYTLLMLLLAMTFCGIFDHDLWTPDEPRAAELGREFLDANHNWFVPTLNNEPFIEKPPLVYWTIAVSLKIFGIHDWATRIPCIVFGLGILIFTYLLGKGLYNKGVGVCSAVVLVTTSGFVMMTHHIECDIGLAFFVTGAAYFLYRAFTGSAGWFVLFYIFALGAFFSKGFIGFAFLALLFLVWVIWERNPKKILQARPWIWIPAMFIPITLWFVKLANDPRGNLLYAFFVENNLYRFFPASMYHGGHIRSFYYYFITLPLGFFPWIIILVIAIPYLWTRRHKTPIKFLASWFLPGFILLSLSLTKRGIYLYPLLTPLVIAVSAWFFAKKKERLLAGTALTLGIIFVISCLLLVPPLNEKKSLRTFGEKLSSMIGPNTRLYGYMADETTLAIVPFYTGRYFTPLEEESALTTLSKESNSEIAIIVLEKRSENQYLEVVRRYFPYVWLNHSNEKSEREMWVLSNVPR